MDGKYPVQNISPSLHSNALENSKHGEKDVVEVCDAAVRAFPGAPTLSIVTHTETAITSKCTRCGIILHVKFCEGTATHADMSLIFFDLCLMSSLATTESTHSDNIFKLD